ncbi:hypothetical protein ACFSTD_03670 [Novosphingobium colocasiae]|uniref:Flagellar basal body-associated FliL family protein n=1 Tax=Novosphingobium colocasiae TaxID=1256513 RepID=A0A918PDS3_9SPHN|nr:hypothetical protein [Novosphingobium colocasiae]GGZ00338.1 hypothetical protein GCM10011614_14220 [Novosphingobium colocasiae]
MIKRIGIGLVTVIAGLGVGAAGAWGVLHSAPQYLTGRPAKPRPVATEFVPPVEVLAPLVLADGRLTGYAKFEIQLEVAQGTTEEVGAKLPLLMNAVNLRTYRTPLASGPDGLVPGLDGFRRVVMDAATEVYGKDVVRSVAVTQAAPA